MYINRLLELVLGVDLNGKGLFCVMTVLLILQVIIFIPVASTKGSDSSIVGVKPGDSNTYGYNVTLFSNYSSNEFLTLPDYQWLSSIDTCKVSVETIVDTNVTAQFSYTFKNGTVSSFTRWAYLATGLVSDDEMGRGFILGLNVTFFNETVPRTYLGSTVQANHFNGGIQNDTVMWPINGTEHEWVFNYTLDLYVNNSTGTMLERIDTLTNMNGTHFSEMIVDIVVIQSNVVPEFPSLLIMPLLITLALTVTLIHRRKQKTSTSFLKKVTHT